MKKRPRWRVYLTDENGDMPTDDDNRWIEFAACWVDRLPDRNGLLKYSGPTGNGKQRVLIYENAPRNEQRFEGNEPPEEDKPF